MKLSCLPKEEDFRIGKVMQMVTGRFRRLGDENLSKHGINVSQLRILAHLSRHSQTREIVQKDLEEAFGVRRSSVTSILQNMEKNGYLERANSPTDARLKKVMLTQKGRELDEELKSYIRLLEEQMLSGITPEEEKTLRSVLIKMLENLEKMEREKV